MSKIEVTCFYYTGLIVCSTSVPNFNFKIALADQEWLMSLTTCVNCGDIFDEQNGQCWACGNELPAPQPLASKSCAQIFEFCLSSQLGLLTALMVANKLQQQLFELVEKYPAGVRYFELHSESHS